MLHGLHQVLHAFDHRQVGRHMCAVAHARHQVHGQAPELVSAHHNSLEYSFDPANVPANVSGQLKVAPEHASDDVLSLMKKPPIAAFTRFAYGAPFAAAYALAGVSAAMRRRAQK